ncbi:nickel-responsive transcriptional regulator NikR [Sulfuricurvum sp. IAE1]|uniref:nickel-responsive transcriptional regulator NikR n=1 Tax=Sulfuricurvum sp. IAE1 TaxID=2546102 RepID=UPI0010521635|nr:nickel-responsive transcriptional regulator NikR [Sulfuricurvum sp. IAE1]TDA68970.1 nickel-responsive transcriptional regulator NikR [Sulfuricurvum sp. IAE1]
MANDAIIRFSVSLPEELLISLDNQIINQGYVSRSEFIRDLIREQIVEDRWNSEEGVIIGVLTLIYDHHQRDLLQKMTDIQHDTDAQVLCNTHVHIDHHNCLETVMIKGTARQVEELAGKISGLKGINFSKLTKTTTF